MLTLFPVSVSPLECLTSLPARNKTPSKTVLPISIPVIVPTLAPSRTISLTALYILSEIVDDFDTIDTTDANGDGSTVGPGVGGRANGFGASSSPGLFP